MHLSFLMQKTEMIYLHYVEPIPQHFEYVKVENQLKMPRTVDTHF